MVLGGLEWESDAEGGSEWVWVWWRLVWVGVALVVGWWVWV